MTRQLAAPYLVCGSDGPRGLPGCVEDDEGFRPFVLLGALASAARQDSSAGLSSVAKDCVVGEIARELQETLSGNPIGRLYAPNIIDEWTQEVTDDANRARGERSVELYWNVSTWNPYQVALFKTRLTARGRTCSSLDCGTSRRRLMRLLPADSTIAGLERNRASERRCAVVETTSRRGDSQLCPFPTLEGAHGSADRQSGDRDRVRSRHRS